MKRYIVIFFSVFFIFTISYGQEVNNAGMNILFHGMVMDAKTQAPLAGSQILINRDFSSVSGDDGTFAFYVNRNDTVLFSMLGYKSTILYISDTLTGREFIAGIYMSTDTLSIGEVVIFPRLRNLKSEILNPRSESDPKIENAKYNLEVSTYQGKMGINKLGDPASNYVLLRQRQRNDAYSKGQIPSDQIAGISPLLIFPAIYLLMNGMPEKPAPLQPHLTDHEISLIHNKYLETHRNN